MHNRTIVTTYCVVFGQIRSCSVWITCTLSFVQDKMDVADECGICEEIPMCLVCNHRHVQGQKCCICGHVGRSMIYQKMRNRANLKRAVKSLFYDGSAFVNCSDDWDMICELRKRVFCAECSIPAELEFNELLEKTSRHVVCYVGDAPTSVARYRLFKSAEGVIGAEIDRLAVMPIYRGGGFSRRILQDILDDAQKFTDNSVTVIRLSTIHDSWMKGKLESVGWRQCQERPVEVRGPLAWVDLVMHANSS